MKKIAFLMMLLAVVISACGGDDDSKFTERNLELSKENLESNGGEYSERYNSERDGTIYLTFKNEELNVVLWNTYKFNKGKYLYSISNNNIVLTSKENGDRYTLSASLKEQGEDVKDVYLIINGGDLPEFIEQKSYVKNSVPRLE